MPKEYHCPIINGLCRADCRFLAPFKDTIRQSCVFEVIPSALNELRMSLDRLEFTISGKGK